MYRILKKHERLDPPRPSERAINSHLANYLQDNLSDTFEVAMSTNIVVPGILPCQYSRSSPDIVIYRKDSYYKNITATCGVVSMATDEEVIEEEYTIFGSSAELKELICVEEMFVNRKHEGQLLAIVEKMAADLVLKVINEHGVLINDVIIYGMLIGTATNEAHLCKLHMTFNEVTKWYVIDTWCELSDGLNKMLSCI